MRKQTILLVDNDRDFVQSFTNCLIKRNDNYTIRTTTNGKDALKILETERIDLVILDIQIQEMGGLHLLAELHNKKKWFPVIILSNSILMADLEGKLVEFGILDYLNKSIDIEVNIRKIEEVLSSSTQSDSISGISLPAILQVLEMEKKTGVLTLKMENTDGIIFFKKGKLVDIEAHGSSVEEILEKYINTKDKNKTIHIEYFNHRRGDKFHKSLTEILLNASRSIDEKNYRRTSGSNL
jgi:CheY-like chemotaxis protein